MEKVKDSTGNSSCEIASADKWVEFVIGKKLKKTPNG